MGKSRERERRPERRDEGARRGPKTPPGGPNIEGTSRGGRRRFGGGRMGFKGGHSRSPRGEKSRNRDENRRKRSPSGELRKVDDLSAEIAHLRQQCAEKERNLQKMFNQLEFPMHAGSPRRRDLGNRWNRTKQSEKMFREEMNRRFKEEHETEPPVEPKMIQIQRESLPPYNIPLNMVQHTKTLPSLVFSCSLRALNAPKAPVTPPKTDLDWDLEGPQGNSPPAFIQSFLETVQLPFGKSATPPPEKTPEKPPDAVKVVEPKEKEVPVVPNKDSEKKSRTPEKRKKSKDRKTKKKEKNKEKSEDIEKLREDFLVKKIPMKEESEKRGEVPKVKEVSKIKEVPKVKEVPKTKEVPKIAEIPKIKEEHKVKEEQPKKEEVRELVIKVDKKENTEKVVKDAKIEKKLSHELKSVEKKVEVHKSERKEEVIVEKKVDKDVKERKKSSPIKKKLPDTPVQAEKPVEIKKIEKQPTIAKKIAQKRKKRLSSSTSTSTTSTSTTTSTSSSSSSDSDSDSDTSSSSSSSTSSSSETSSKTSSSDGEKHVKKSTKKRKLNIHGGGGDKKEKEKQTIVQEPPAEGEGRPIEEVLEAMPLILPKVIPKVQEAEESVVESTREVECHTPPLPPEMINISPAKRTPIVLKLQGKADKVTPSLIPAAMAKDAEDDDFTEGLRAKSKSPSEDSDAKLVTTTCGPEVEELALLRAAEEERARFRAEQELVRARIRAEQEEEREKRKRYRSPTRQRRHRSPSPERRSSWNQRRVVSPVRHRRFRRESPPPRRRRISPRPSPRRRRRSRSRSWTRSMSRSRSRSRERVRRRSPWRPPSVTGLNFLTDKRPQWDDWDTVYEKASTDRSFYPFEGTTYDQRRPDSQWTVAPAPGPVSPPHRSSLDDRINSALNEPIRDMSERQNAIPIATYQQQPNYHHQFPMYTGPGFPRPYHSTNEYSLYTESIYHHNTLQQQMIDPNFQHGSQSSNLISIPQVEQPQMPQNILQKGNVIEVVPTIQEVTPKAPSTPQNPTASPAMHKKPFFPPVGTPVKVIKTAEQRKAMREKKRMEKKMRKKKLEFELKQLLSGSQTVDITSEELLPEVLVEPEKEAAPISVIVVKKVIFSDGVIPGASSSDSGVSSSDESISPDTLSGMTANQVKKFRKQRRKKKELNKENSLIIEDKVETLPPVRDPRLRAEPMRTPIKEEDTTNYPPPSPPPGDPPPCTVQPMLKKEIQERPKKLLYFNAVHREKRMDIFSIYVPPSAFVKVQDPRLQKHPMLIRRRIAAPLFPVNVYPRPPQPYPHLPPVQVSPATGIRAPPAYSVPPSRIPVLGHPSAIAPPYPPPPLPTAPMHALPPMPHYPPSPYYMNNGPIPPTRY